MQRPAIEVERVRLANDVRGFARRACPVCTRVFKVRSGRSEDRLVQAVFVANLRHANAEELPGPPRRFCPYCAHAAPADAFLTTAQRAYIEAHAKWTAASVQQVQLRDVARGRCQPTFVPVAPSPEVAAPPAEPDDLRSARVVCCAEELKLDGAWRGPFYCHHCRARQGG